MFSIALFQDLPMCNFKLDTLDSQPVLKKFTNDRDTLLVTTTGTIKFEHHKLQAFTQTFVIINEQQSWKIFTDTIRLREI